MSIFYAILTFLAYAIIYISLLCLAVACVIAINEMDDTTRKVRKAAMSCIVVIDATLSICTFYEIFPLLWLTLIGVGMLILALVIMLDQYSRNICVREAIRHTWFKFRDWLEDRSRNNA